MFCSFAASIKYHIMRYPFQYQSPEANYNLSKSGDRVFVHGSAQTPYYPSKTPFILQTDRLRDVG